MKLQLTVLRCGSCGKPRGRYHVCTGKRGKRDRVTLRLRFTCPHCRREMPNPFGHTCRVRTDFAKRRRAAERAEKARVRRERARKRKAEAAARRRAAAKKRRAEAQAQPRRRRVPAHNPRTCKDPDCQRYGCLKYREGWDDGFDAGKVVGYLAGYGDGQDDGYAAGFADGSAARGSE